ncbi:MAG: hypothetical protein KAS48_07945 [Gammaproteobacteria bacterium]|nr:hypothetical protein [Gammaproteobacteria bacterium]
MDINLSELSCWIFRYQDSLSTIAAAILAAIIAPLLGLLVYFKQKQYDLVRARYLENGLDVVSAQVEYTLGIFRHNWARGLNVLKHFRDMGADMPKELYKSGFIEIDPASYKTAHSYLLREMTGDDVYHHVLQLLFTFVHSTNAMLMYDLCSIVRLSIEGGTENEIKSSREEIMNSYFPLLEELNNKAERFYLIQAALMDLSSVLIRKKFTFNNIDNFRDDQTVKRTIEKLKNEFEKDIKEYIPHEES